MTGDGRDLREEMRNKMREQYHGDGHRVNMGAVSHEFEGGYRHGYQDGYEHAMRDHAGRREEEHRRRDF